MRYLLYTILFLIVLFVFFVDRKDNGTYIPIREGILYSINSGSKTIIPEEVTNIVVYRNSQNEIPVIKVYTELQLPPQFEVTLSRDREDASYILSSSSRETMPVEKPRQVPARKRKDTPQQVLIAPATRPIAKPVTVIKESKEAPMNFNILNNAIKESNKTFFFSEKEVSKGDITARVYCVTPWRNKDILKFQMINSGQQYFFIANVSLFKGEQLIPVEYYNDLVVAPGQTLDCIALIPEQIKTPLLLKVIESGGKSRIFSISYTIP